MGIVEIITGVTLLVGAATALWREIRGVKKMSRSQIIGEAEKIAWHAVEATKRASKTKLTRDEIWREYQKELLKYLSGKGLGKLSKTEWNGIRESAEVITHAVKDGLMK